MSKANKRKAPSEKKVEVEKVEVVRESEDEALGDDLELDKSGSESDDSDSSAYSDLEGEDEDDSDDEDEDEEDDSESGSSDSDDSMDGEDKSGKKAEENKEDKVKVNEYEEGDSSDEEDIRNTIGNIPVNWYDEYGHIGYDLDGKKIRKPKRGDELSHFLSRMENPEHGVTVEDPTTGQQVGVGSGGVGRDGGT